MFIKLWLLDYIDVGVGVCTQYRIHSEVTDNSGELVLSTMKVSGMELESLSLVPFPANPYHWPLLYYSKNKNPNLLRFTIAMWIPLFILVALDSSEKIARPVFALLCLAQALNARNQPGHFLFLKSLYSLTINFITKILEKKDSDS